MTEEANVGGDARLGAFHLAIASLAPQLPGEFADLGQGLGGHGFAEAGKPAAGVYRDAATDGRVPGAQQLFRLALRAELQVLVPVQFQRR